MLTDKGSGIFMNLYESFRSPWSEVRIVTNKLSNSAEEFGHKVIASIKKKADK